MEQTSTLTPEQLKEVVAKRERERIEEEKIKIGSVLKKLETDIKKEKNIFPDLTIAEIYNYHGRLIKIIADEYCLRQQRRQLVLDENNKDVFRFLLYYFNNCPLAEQVFPNKKYKLEKNILLMGNVGAGKTLIMQIFSEYLKRTNNPNFFYNLSVTQMVNYYSIHGNLDRYTYNEEASTGFMPNPVNVCLNDIGIESRLHYGQDTKILTKDFLHARNEIWTQTAHDRRKCAHLTTNLNKKQLETEFDDLFGRLVDRFKTYNIIELKGTSRR